MARKSAVTQEVTEEKPQDILEAEQHLRELRIQHRRKSVIEQAEKDLAEFESEYERAKLVFFKVNAARRVLKNG